MNSALRRYVITGVALVGASVIAVTPATAPLPDFHVPDVQLTADEETITLDIVRHGETVGPQSTVDTGAIPGDPLDETGQEEAQAVAEQLAPQGPYAGIYAGEDVRMPETAAPLADLENLTVQILPGLNEIGGGIYAGDALSSPGGILYELTLAAWALGFVLVPMPGSTDLNGVVFDESFGGAVQTIYDNTVSAANTTGSMSDVAFSGEAAISTWALMNANNPEISIFLPLFLNDLVSGEAFLNEGGIVEVQGDPEEGWTLVSFNGTSIPQDPGLLTELFVDVRNLIEAPQFAAYNIYEALLTGDSTTITTAIQDNLDNVGTAIFQFPQSVITDIIGALGDGTSAGGQVTGETLSDALASLASLI
jgi:Histidine phosphatase superfamily (branch 1)